MQDLIKSAEVLKKEIDSSVEAIELDDLARKLKRLIKISKQANFWDDSDIAQATMQEIGTIGSQVTEWSELRTASQELVELTKTNDENLTDELEEQLRALTKNHESLKKQLMFSGVYDKNSAIVTIFAGAGGTDAQDWAMMLERMYLRYFEQQKYKTKVIDRSAGEEAGIKSVVIEVNGRFAYGRLQGEHGVHRLVRLSPFNSKNLRQTSFAKVDVLPKIDKPKDIEIDEKDLKIDVFRAGGHGGQSVNTTDSAVRVTHIPTDIVVSIQNERSQLQNKETALTILRSKLAQLKMEQHQDKIQLIKGPNKSAEWGNQIRSYVLHPYKQVKDLRTKHETPNIGEVLDGKLEDFIESYLEKNMQTKK